MTTYRYHVHCNAGELAELKDLCDSTMEFTDELTTENNELLAEKKSLAAENKELVRTQGELLSANKALQTAAAEEARKAAGANGALSAQVCPCSHFALCTF